MGIAEGKSRERNWEKETESQAGLVGKWFPWNREIAPGYPQNMLLFRSSHFDKWDHAVLPVQTTWSQPNPGLRNGTHTVTTHFLPHWLCWCWNRFKQMFPVKLWIFPHRIHQHPQSLQATNKTRVPKQLDSSLNSYLIC